MASSYAYTSVQPGVSRSARDSHLNPVSVSTWRAPCSLAIAASWVEDGVFDRGENLSSPRGREALAAQVNSPAHQAAIAGGLAHFTGLPHVMIDGDTAVVTSYLAILVPQTQGDPVEVPNHGSGKGFRVFRMTANRWELVRTPQGWKFKHRSTRQLDGSEPARKILRGALRK